MRTLNFENTTILITGASSGIGKEFAKQLASKSANLILTARTHADLKKLADELESEYTNIWVRAIPVRVALKVRSLRFQTPRLCHFAVFQFASNAASIDMRLIEVVMRLIEVDMSDAPTGGGCGDSSPRWK